MAKKTQHLIGLDIGTRYVKAILLEQHKQHITLLAIACESINGHAFADREIKDYEALSQALKKVKLSLKSKAKQVAIAVSGQAVINKLAYMDDDLTDIELESQIEIEADSLIPYPLEEIYLDFERLGPSASYPNKVEVLLSAVHKDIIDSRLTLLNEVGFETKIADVEVYALANAVMRFTATSESINDNSGPLVDKVVQCCINIGASQLQFCAVSDGKVLYTKEHNFGLDVLTQDSCSNFNLTRIQYEQQLTTNSLPESWHRDCYMLFQANLQQHVTRAIQMYVSSTHQPSPQQLLICGAVGPFQNLARELNQELNIEVQIFNPLLGMQSDDKNAELITSQGANFAIAVGLALRGFAPCHI
nr:type IV pilus assembly protein PilM [Paraglaciecola sp. 20A4]